MQVKLDSQQAFMRKDGTFDQKMALVNAGVKAAVCYKEALNGVVTPQIIRESESDTTLIRRGIDTLFSAHTSPTEHQIVGLEITGIPKIMCMVLNNEHQYQADERSLRYTEIEPNKYITKEEYILYQKWLVRFEEIINKKYGDFYDRVCKVEKEKKKVIHKLAQENARYVVSVFMPTTLTYTVPWIQLNKILTYMQKVIDQPMNDFEKLLVPYFKDFIDQCKKLKVAITKNDVYEIGVSDGSLWEKMSKSHPEVNGYSKNNELFYKDSKGVDLSLFANRNEFSGINATNEFGVNLSYNNYESFACLAQEQRHRVLSTEMLILDDFSSYVPPIIRDDMESTLEFINDVASVKEVHPQGEIIKVNRCGTVKNVLKFVAQERACEHAQLEIMQVYTDALIPDLYDGLVINENHDLAGQVKPYVKKLRCGFPNYHCPLPCGNPRINRCI